MSLQVLNQLRVNGVTGFTALLAVNKVETKVATSRSLVVAFPRWQTIQPLPGTDLKVPQPVKFSRAQLAEMVRFCDGTTDSKFESEVKQCAPENILRFMSHFGLNSEEGQTMKDLTLEYDKNGEPTGLSGVTSARAAIQALSTLLNKLADGRILDPEETLYRSLGTSRPYAEMAEFTDEDINLHVQDTCRRRDLDTQRLREVGLTWDKARVYFASLVAKNGLDAAGYVQWRSPKETTSATSGDAFQLLDDEARVVTEDLEQDS